MMNGYIYVITTRGLGSIGESCFYGISYSEKIFSKICCSSAKMSVFLRWPWGGVVTTEDYR